jgi:drug/metabolite transporter (DMT)-like permease
VFFRLIAEVGPARATLITFVNPAVAVVVGAVVLDEEITVSTLVGFALVLAGCWLATRHRPEVIPDSPVVVDADVHGLAPGPSR